MKLTLTKTQLRNIGMRPQQVKVVAPPQVVIGNEATKTWKTGFNKVIKLDEKRLSDMH